MALTNQTMPIENSPSVSNTAASSRLLISLMLLVAALWCVYWFFHALHYWEDDAYIHLEFARSVAAGQGFAFNGHVVAGDTSPMWVFLLVGMHLFISNWLIAGKTLTVLGALFGFSGIYAFSRRMAHLFLPASGASLFPAAIVLLTAINPYTCYWMFSGMEPVAGAGLACWAVLLATADTPCIRKFLIGCLLAGIGPLVRPEMTFLTLLLAAPLIGQWSRLTLRPPAKTFLFLVGLVFVAAPLTLWGFYSLHAFGHFLPNTNAAKRAAPGDSVPMRLLQVYGFGEPLILLGTLAGVLYMALRPAEVVRSLRNALGNISARSSEIQKARGNSKTLPLAGWIFVLWPLIATCFYIADHTYVQTRYIYISAPALTIVLLAIALKVSLRLGKIIYTSALLAGVLASVLVAWPLIRNKDINCTLTRQLALYIRDQIPANDPVAVYSIGEIAFYSRHPIIDTGGITRPGAIPYLNDPVGVLRWARSQGAKYAISGISPEPGSILLFHCDQRFLGWTLHLKSYSMSSPVGLWKLPEAKPAP